MNKNKWNELVARRYEQYATRYSLYKKTSQFLVKIANIKKGTIVIDLACGTGVMIPEILKGVGSSGKIIGVDISKDLLDIAKRKVKQENVFFIQAPAENIDEVIKEKADLVLCNSAFWLMSMKKVLMNLNVLVKNGGKFVFNLPDYYFDVYKKNNFEFMNRIEEILKRKFNYTSNKTKQITFDEIEKLLEENSFKLESIKTLEIVRTMEDIYEFFKIPIMMKGIIPMGTYEEKIEILNNVYQSVDKSKKYVSKFIYFSAKKT